MIEKDNYEKKGNNALKGVGAGQARDQGSKKVDRGMRGRMRVG